MGSKPNLWMFAGPNGSGKSTFYTETRIVEDDAPLWIINPDKLTSEIASREGLPWIRANGIALDRIKLWLDASIGMYKPIGFETVLSSDKYLPMIDRALALGYQFRLIYVTLNDPKLHIERVRKRVAQGGHAVDEAKIVARRLKSFDRFERVFPKAQFAQVWDNSGSKLNLLFEKVGDEVTAFDTAAIPEITKRVMRAVSRSVEDDS
jgi:predicted ABC-type ATPase